MAAGPIPIGLPASIKDHTQTVTRIEPRATDLCQLPSRSKIPSSPFRICFESPGSNDDRFGANNILFAAVDVPRKDLYAVHHTVRSAQTQSSRIVMDRHSSAGSGRKQG